MKIAATAALFAALFTTSALAAEAIINVTANIDPTLELRNADGTLLEQNVRMGYLPGVGLDGHRMETKIYTNDKAKNISVRLGSAAQLVHATDTSAPAIPLTVTLGTKSLTTADQTLTAAELFGVASGVGESVTLPLVISQTTKEVVDVAGTYNGMVQLVLAQAVGS